MKLKVGAIVGALILVTACGPTEDETKPLADVQLPNELFDAAVSAKMSVVGFDQRRSADV